MDAEDLYDEDDGLQECNSDDEELHFSGEDCSGSGGGGSEGKEVGIAASQTLTPDTLSKKMFEIIHEVNSVFQVSKIVSTCLPR